eukprot:scaffold480_cov257-Pinguiococcus_pyrenoidosus.AAC.4
MFGKTNLRQVTARSCLLARQGHRPQERSRVRPGKPAQSFRVRSGAFGGEWIGEKQVAENSQQHNGWSLLPIPLLPCRKHTCATNYAQHLAARGEGQTSWWEGKSTPSHPCRPSLAPTSADFSSGSFATSAASPHHVLQGYGTRRDQGINTTRPMRRPEPFCCQGPCLASLECPPCKAPADTRSLLATPTEQEERKQRKELFGTLGSEL